MAPSAAAAKKADDRQARSSFIKYYDTLRYHVVPPIFVVVFTLAAQLLVFKGNPSEAFQWDRFVVSQSQSILRTLKVTFC